MKYLGTFIFFCFAIICIWSCSPKQESGNETAESEEWKAMDDFHMIMAESFHPFRDSANLEPVKIYAREMTKLADQWLNSELPTRVDNEEVKEQLGELKVATEELLDLVEVGDDTAIGTSLTNVHDAFHHLQESWYRKGHD